MKRSGFSLIELVVALISATVLVLGLASTVVVTTQLLESPPDDAGELHQRVLVDRLAADLRYASDVTDGVGNGFEIERPDPTTGSGQRVTYESTTDGFTRSVDGGAPALFDPDQSRTRFRLTATRLPRLAKHRRRFDCAARVKPAALAVLTTSESRCLSAASTATC